MSKAIEALLVKSLDEFGRGSTSYGICLVEEALSLLRAGEMEETGEYRCPCPHHPINCDGHPHSCACAAPPLPQEEIDADNDRPRDAIRRKWL